MSQIEIVQRGIALQGTGHGSKRRFMRWFNEGMGIYAICEKTLYNWLGAETKPDPQVLQHAVDVYPVDDPRGMWAREMMQVGEGE
jgi:hypothetical protein